MTQYQSSSRSSASSVVPCFTFATTPLKSVGRTRIVAESFTTFRVGMTCAAASRAAATKVSVRTRVVRASSRRRIGVVSVPTVFRPRRAAASCATARSRAQECRATMSAMRDQRQPGAPRRLRFGLFDFDPGAGELRREGVPVRLQPQPAAVLAYLVARPGEVVTRDALRDAVWGGETFVDFDRG